MSLTLKHTQTQSLNEVDLQLHETTGIERPQCVLCLKVLAAELMKPSKLKNHLLTRHAEHAGKDVLFFERKRNGLKRQRLDSSETFKQEFAAATEASYSVSYLIAKKKEPHNIGEDITLPTAKILVKQVIGDSAAKKLNHVSLSNDTVYRRIIEMATDVKECVVGEIKQAGLFSMALDESTDVQSCA
ncbi:zinc finger BED domain-containing protein 5-like [Hydra vulgaris]|uniref:Zinc finger BED domain-containing protein 5-like n=1 Tax=Hydra vulgaris TaxID=6087 RepID=A0ABM4C981_HYDVU